MGTVMELFRAEKFGVLKSDQSSHRECRFCHNKLRLIRAVHYPETEETIRVFECDCGERTWDE
jgi:dTDP-4-dehydrorhamnose 3,5-epimerase-like enzyme